MLVTVGTPPLLVRRSRELQGAGRMCPSLAAGCMFAAPRVALLTAAGVPGLQRKVWCRCDFAFSTFLLGHHPQHAQQQQHHQAAEPQEAEQLPV